MPRRARVGAALLAALALFTGSMPAAALSPAPSVPTPTPVRATQTPQPATPTPKASATPTPTPTPRALPTPKPSATATPKPSATLTPKPSAPPTPKASATPPPATPATRLQGSAPPQKSPSTGLPRLSPAGAPRQLNQVAEAPGMKIVFTAIDRDEKGDAHGFEHIYTADADGSNIRRITGKRDEKGNQVDDGFNYAWAVWAMNGRKIVFTKRHGLDEEDSQGRSVQEDIWIMDPDGSNAVQLTDNPWRNGQPKVSPDGRSLLFTSFWDEFPKVAVYRLDLATLEVENLSAHTFTDGAFDSDPRWSAHGKRIVFASSRKGLGEMPTQNFVMASDGTERRQITEDRYYNTDPALSPDGRQVAISSYRGPGHPNPKGSKSAFEVFLWDWRLVARDLDQPRERELTRGDRCVERDPENPCAVNQGPAWVPVWSPDGKSIGYISILSSNRMCICVIDADGGNPRTILITGDNQGWIGCSEGDRRCSDKAITWWDWVEPGPPPPGALERIGQSFSGLHLLFGGSVYGLLKPGEQVPEPRLFVGSPDRWTSREVIPEPSQLVGERLIPRLARWTPDRKHIVFTARRHYDPARPEHEPAVPPGQSRRTHFTLDDFELGWDPPLPVIPHAAEEQVFLMDEDGRHVLPVSSSWTEDYLDAIPDGEARGNTDPDMSPDGRYVVFTNLSTTTLESFILRRDLETNEVINLTNVTAGPVRVADAKPRFSPDGSTIAFASNVGHTSQVFLMDRDGGHVRQLTDDDFFNTDAAWSPDGRWLVYSSYRGPDSPVVVLKEDEFGNVLDSRPQVQGWVLVKVEVKTGVQRQLTSGAHSAFRPVWSPDGKRIGFIHVIAERQPDIYVVDPNGKAEKPLAVTMLTKEEYFDWR